MWYAMLFLYPELFPKFDIEIPAFEALSELGFPKDKPSGIFLEWLDTWVDYCHCDKNDREGLHTELRDWRKIFIDSIEDEYKKTICSRIIYASWP